LIGDLYALDRFVRSASKKVTASIVLVKANPYATGPINYWVELDQKAAKLFEKIKTAGIIFLSSQKPLKLWYNDLLFELSHTAPKRV
jgi:hypothetical protein